MSYRDDRDADRARISALEAELQTARRRIDELEGRRSQALVQASSSALARAGGDPRGKQPWYGAPMRLELTRTFDKEFPRDDFEELVEVIRATTRDSGRTEVLRSSLTWSSTAPEKGVGPFLVVTVSARDGRTTLTVTDRLGQLAGGIYGGVGGGVGGGAIILPILAAKAIPFLIPVAVLGWLGGVFWASRSIFKRSATRRAESLQQLFDAVSAEIEARLAVQRG